MSLMPNPLGELVAPVHRLEREVTGLKDALGAVDTLPEIHREVCALHEAVLSLLDELRGLRADLGRPGRDGHAPVP